MRWWLKWLVIGSLATWLGYCRHWTSQIVRTRTANSPRITTSVANNTDSFQFFNRSQQINNSYFECEITVYAHGLCSNVQVPPMQRPCTPALHIHFNQTEYFTLLQGQLGYQLGDKVYSCDIHTCPRPLIISPLVPHTFWASDNKEDLIVRVRIEPTNKYSGIRQEFFENLAGVIRDQHTSIFQMLLLLEQAKTYPAFLPLPLAKLMVKICALIGQLLGYKIEYEEYTTIADDFN